MAHVSTQRRPERPLNSVFSAHPWVRGSSHCVVLVLWFTKYTLSLESTRLSGVDQSTEGSHARAADLLRSSVTPVTSKGGQLPQREAEACQQRRKATHPNQEVGGQEDHSQQTSWMPGTHTHPRAHARTHTHRHNL